MTNQNNQPPHSPNDEIADALYYWANAQPEHQSISVDDIQRKRHRRTFKRYAMGIGCLLVLVAIPLSLVRPNTTAPNSQIAQHQSPTPQVEHDPLAQAKSNDAKWDALVAQIQTEKEALQEQLAALEQSRVTARIDRSLALAEKARQWAADQKTNF